MKRDDIVISKADVQAYAESIGACTQVRRSISSLPEETTARDIWSGLSAKSKAWLICCKFFEPSGGVFCFIDDCECDDSKNAETKCRAIARRWPYERVLKFLIGDLP
jgi:hypothetical protein